MDLITAGLAATNEKFNNILKKVNTTTEAMKSSIQIDASVASEAIGSQLSALEGELRGLVPAGLSLPNINLQSQLSSLSKIANSAQSSSLLSSITSNFGSALSASGFSLDSLVSSSASAIAAGKSLSFDIPNFELPAGGGDAVQKAIGVKLPKDDPVEEVPATIQENLEQSAAKTAASSSVIVTSPTLPKEDTEQLTISTKTTKVTQKSITAEVTTAADAFEGDKRKNISKAGFSTRPITITENVLLDSVSSGVAGSVIELKQIPTKVTSVKGFDEDGKRRFIVEEPLNKAQVGKFDTFTVSGKEILISEILRNYIEAPARKAKGKKGLTFIVRYQTNSTYDPTYKV
tara:strand:+ start:63 stop:1103 length:1041 start_codon:yes stop_codon:yes gene_type:complete